MKNDIELTVISKLIPIINLNVIEDEYLLSSDFCCPLHTLVNNKTGDICEEDLKGSHSDKFSIHHSHPNTNVCSCMLDTSNDLDIMKMKIKLEMLLFSIVMSELRRSKAFRTNILSNFYVSYHAKSKNIPHRRKLCSLCQRLTCRIHVYVYLYETRKQVFDFCWNKRLQILVNERCELENAMAWLSTLGGAFSALGDTFIDCAEKAGLISIKQFQLALRIGDPITICRCKIYLAMSLLQRGYYRKAENMVRDLYDFSIGPDGSKDFRLKNMCIAVWNRLKYVLSENRKSKSNLTEKKRFTPHC